MKLCYKSKRFRAATLAIIEQANAIIAVYKEQGFSLMLRQLYYQFVARNLFENTSRNYKNFGKIISDARLAGLMDWKAIEDRTRNLQSPQCWDSPEEILQACERSYRRDMWANQPYRPEVWVEKEALAGVFEPVCDELGISLMACRGYMSQSEMWSNAMRLDKSMEVCEPIILHFGDHDPSGLDMTRDIEDRLRLFTGGVEVRRIALDMDQIEEYDPPPNPAKWKDSRFGGYRDEHGDESWELDALEPAVLADLVRREVLAVRDEDEWDVAVERERIERSRLTKLIEQLEPDA